jgi:hypothetical protein
MTVGPSPFSSTATTPVRPTPSVTSKPSARAFGELGRGLDFLEAEFGIGVQILIKGNEFGHVLRDCGAQFVSRARRTPGKRERCSY